MNNTEVLIKFKGNDEELKKTEKSVGERLSNFGKNAAKTTGLVLGAAATAGAAAITSITKSAVEGFAEYEQLVGGVETLFKDSADIVQNYAEEAYKNAGISANKYMETVTSFSASLLQSLNGDTAKSAKIADMAITDMSDNANKMGTSMEAIQNAYQGFAKQNYTMLDNLKLGYGGTRGEMERLLADASKLTGIEYNIDNLSDVFEAIHVIQGELGITGTTAKEASSTISGSLNMTKASFQDFLTSLASGENIDGALNNLVNSVGIFGENLLPVIEKVLTSITNVLPNIITKVIEILPTLLENVLPGLIKGVVNLIQGLVIALPELLNGLLPALLEGVVMIVEALIEALPDIIIMLADMLPTLIPMIIDAVLKVIPALIEHLPDFVKAGGQLIMGLVKGIINAIPTIIKNILNIGKTILSTIKGFFGIHSPSKVMADEIGQYLPKGMAVGIEANADSVTDAVGDIEKNIDSTFGMDGRTIGAMEGNLSPVVNVYSSFEMDPLGQIVSKMKTFTGGAKNDYNYGGGV